MFSHRHRVLWSSAVKGPFREGAHRPAVDTLLAYSPVLAKVSDVLRAVQAPRPENQSYRRDDRPLTRMGSCVADTNRSQSQTVSFRLHRAEHVQ